MANRLVEFTGLLKRVGQTIEQIGPDRDATLKEFGQAVNGEVIELVDSLLAGLA